MIEGNRSFVDPTEVLNLVYDEASKPVKIGDQKDIIEYLMIFFEHMEIGFRFCGEEPKQSVKNENNLSSENISLKIMDMFKGKIVAEILDDSKSLRPNSLIEESFGPLFVDVRYSDLVESLRQKFIYPIKVNNDVS